MNFWKIGSRWSSEGNKDSSVLDIFRKYRIVFSGSKSDRISREVKVGDFIAISDGKKIVCISKVLEVPKSITKFTFDEVDKVRFAYQDWVLGIKVNIVDLVNFIDYRIGAFHKMNSHKETLKKIYENNNKEFSIDARKYCIYQTENSLIKDEIKYIIPVYQRPYSWGVNEISKFIKDILSSYKEKEPVFFGTIQLSEKKYFNGIILEQEIIDGQQRTTTIFVFLKLLSLKYSEVRYENKWFLDRIETRVNRPTQNLYLREYFELESLDELLENENNKYMQNAIFMNSTLDTYLTEDFSVEKHQEFNVTDFLDNHFYKNLLFIAIETKASLSKTLQIFDTINTTGLDLQGADIFKVRMYEYLKDKQQKGEMAFDEINKIYSKVDELKNEGICTDMNEILTIYQLFLIGKYNLNNALYSLNVNTFFERFFDQILNINSHTDFGNVIEKNVLLSIEDLTEIITIRKDFPNDKTEWSSIIEYCEYSLIHRSRYSRYWLLIFSFWKRFGKDDDFIDKRVEFISKLSKVLNIYSIRQQKAINEIHRFMRSLNQQILQKETKATFEEIIDKLIKKIIIDKDEFRNHLSKEIASNRKWKNIICRTSAILEDLNSKSNYKLFEVKIDIEHIQSNNDENLEKRQQIKDEWGSELHSIGNLIVLEQGLNRSILNYSDKKDKLYSESTFQIVKNFRGKEFKPNEWTKEKALERRKYEVEKLMKYYFS